MAENIVYTMYFFILISSNTVTFVLMLFNIFIVFLLH